MNISDFSIFQRKFGRVGVLLALTAALVAISTAAEEAHQHRHGDARQAPPPFVASTAKSFAQLMDGAMTVMDYGMTTAPMTGDPDHDFAAMMIPHHQGAIDMAKVELLYGKNPVLRRLAQEIIVTQGSEIAVMQAALNKQPANGTVQH